MRVTVTGASGLIGRRLVRRLRERGDDVTVLSREPARAHRALGVAAVGWGSAPSAAHRDAQAEMILSAATVGP